MEVSPPSRTVTSMSVTNARASRLEDADLPELAVLLADGVPPPLGAAVGMIDATLGEAVVRQVTWWPGRSVTVRYDVRFEGAVEGPGQVVAVAGEIPPGAVVVERREPVSASGGCPTIRFCPASGWLSTARR